MANTEHRSLQGVTPQIGATPALRLISAKRYGLAVSTIDRGAWVAETGGIMSRYSGLLEKRVEVLYRAGEIHLPVTATLVADSGKSIFLEERFLHHDKVRTFRWEIPYPCILRIQELAAAPGPEPPVADAPEPAASEVAAEALGLQQSPEKA